MNENISKNLPRDTFMYLLSIVSLVAVSVSFGALIFQYINIYFPDVATDLYRPLSSYYMIIFQSLAVLIVFFPVFVWVLAFIRRDVAKNLEKREMRIRRWLLYLTVFAAALVIIGDLVSVINSFLRGELTTRFILKALTMFFIAGSAFYYYFSELKEEGIKNVKVFAWLIGVIVLAVIVAGFAIAGSPAEQRLKRFDDQKVSDLQMIQSQIINYWQRKESLPPNLIALNDSISGFMVPNDSQTGEIYEYRILGVAGKPKFELCATFNKESDPANLVRPETIPTKYGSPMADNWEHKAGRHCYQRTIDPQLYPLITVPR